MRRDDSLEDPILCAKILRFTRLYEKLMNIMQLRVRPLFLFMVAHTAILSFCAVRQGFAWTETGLLPAGLLDWYHGAFDVYRVNPPLVRMWATLPLVIAGADMPVQPLSIPPHQRAEVDVSRRMLEEHGADAYNWLAIARLMCIPFSLLGMAVAYRWSSQLYGVECGIGAALMWTFAPMFIGYGSLISGDMQAASVGLLVLYLFSMWLPKPTAAGALVLGFAIGLAVLTKSTWLVLFALIPMLWLAVRMVSLPGGLKCSFARMRTLAFECSLLASALFVSLVTINALYGFSGSFRPLGSYEFISRSLSGRADWTSHDGAGNRFRGSVLGALPLPLPEDFVAGLDLQKWDFDRERWSYLRGEWRNHGWWYYYLYGLAVKVPVGAWVVVLVGVVGAMRNKSWRAGWQNELLLCASLVFLLVTVSSQMGLNRHLRYLLPMYPFALVLASRAFKVYRGMRSWKSGVVTVASTWMILSSLWIYPHSLSYFNEFVGGPMNGSRHLNASNIDWGQDLRYVGRWSAANPDARPLYITSWLYVINPNLLGIDSLGSAPRMPTESFFVSSADGPFRAGWYAVDQESLINMEGSYDYLRTLPVDARAGYGFNIYHVSEELAEKLNSSIVVAR